ncbi:MAG: hypothetical protein ABL930_07010, partial [Pseudobdellovibrio sp.]
SDYMKARTEIIYERFFNCDEVNPTYNLESLRGKIKSSKKDFTKIAQHIREHFEFSSYRPLTYEILNDIYDRIKVRTYFLPFSSIKLNTGNDTEQTAILFTKNELHAVLVNSDRTIDEAHFDKIHELLHICFGNIDMDNDSLEKLIDKVCGELIYPKTYIIEKFFDGDANSKPIKEKQVISKKFNLEARDNMFILSPKGLARAMRDADLATTNSELYKYIYTELHELYRKEAINYSMLGKMDFDFSNRDQIMNFYKDIEENTFGARYPLFEKLKCDLLSEKLSANDFADTFGLKLSDAMIIKKIWSDRALNATSTNK